MIARPTLLTDRSTVPDATVSGPTAAASYVAGVIDYAVGRGAPRAAILHAAGLVERDFADPFTRLPIEAMIAVMRTGAMRLDDPAFALHFGEAVDCGSLTVTAMLGAAATTVGEALVRIGRYAPLGLDFPAMGDAPRYRAEPAGTRVWIVDARPADDWPEVTEAAFARMTRGIRRAGGTGLLHAVRVTHRAPAHAAEYARAFGVPVEFAADRNGLLVEASYLAMPLTPPPRHVTSALATFADEQLDALARRRSVRGRVEQVLRTLLPRGAAGIVHVARALAMSRQTLYRRLRAEGTTFEAVLDALRHRMALELLQRDAITIGEVAALTGFSDVAAFSRAFRRWTGQAPTAVRQARRARVAGHAPA